MPSFERAHFQERPSVRGGYRLPFSNRPVDIIQGYNGPHSHAAFYTIIHATGERGTLQDDRFSLDFRLPLGTEIVAAKDGVVSGITFNRTDYYDGLDFEIGMKQIPNVLYLKHEDGSRTVYSHLEAHSITLMMGNAVRQGQPIARSGLSGWVGPVPHLHFAALIFPEPWVRRTFPVAFDDYQGELEHKVLEELGFSYG